MDIPAAIAADAAITRQNAILSTVKANADADQLFAQVIEEAARNAPVSGTRGSNVDIFA